MARVIFFKETSYPPGNLMVRPLDLNRMYVSDAISYFDYLELWKSKKWLKQNPYARNSNDLQQNLLYSFIYLYFINEL